jgi:hypothetical protein
MKYFSLFIVNELRTKKPMATDDQAWITRIASPSTVPGMALYACGFDSTLGTNRFKSYGINL